MEMLEGGVTLLPGDCLEVLKTLEPNSVDACVTDPPYHLTNRTPDVKWCADCERVLGGNDGKPSACPKCGGRLEYQRSQGGRGFMGKQWDGGDIAFRPELWREVLRVLKPGSYIVAFSSSRTYHRMACAIEDAGFITHPLIAWITGQGFPKAHNVSKHIDKMAGAEREVVGSRHADDIRGGNLMHRAVGENDKTHIIDITAPATDLAREWEGYYYGTQSLKPAIEPIYVGQKPFEKGLNGTENILKWGVGALNIDGCRVATGEDLNGGCHSPNVTPRAMAPGGAPRNVTAGEYQQPLGRWPANVILTIPEDEYQLRGDATPEQRRELFQWLSENA